MDIFNWVLLMLVLVGVAVVIRSFRQASRDQAAAIARADAARRAAKDAWFEQRNKGVVHHPAPPLRSVKSPPPPRAEKSPPSMRKDDAGNYFDASQLGLMSGGSWPAPSHSSSYSGGGGTFDGGGASGDYGSSSSCSSSDSSSSGSSDSGSCSSSSD